MCSTCDCKEKSVATDGPGSQLETCRKCGGDSYIVLDKAHHYCRSCFMDACIKKSRSAIGKTRLIKTNDPILLAYSGGASSSALLSLVKDSIAFGDRKEPRFRPSILHIDTQSILTPSSESEKEERIVNLGLLLHSLKDLYPDWPIYWTTVEVGLADNKDHVAYSKFESSEPLDDSKFDPLLNNHEAQKALQDQLNQRSDLTERHRFAQELTANLINRVASSINSSFSEPEDALKFVLTAGSATRLANNLLVDVIMGRGATIRNTVSVCDTRPQVPVMRPMRDFSKKEIAFYLRAKHIQAHVQPNLVTFADRKSSLQTVTEAFLSKLYVDYPSTYTTLLRTGNKMQE